MKKALLALAIAASLATPSAFAATALPTSGSCQFLITLPVPLGVASINQTGYNITGVLTFTSSTTATMSGYVTNANYSSAGSPTLAAPVIFNNSAVSITSMTTATGFVGGYFLAITAPFAAQFTAVPANSGNTIFMQVSGGPLGPGSGVCQF